MQRVQKPQGRRDGGHEPGAIPVQAQGGTGLEHRDQEQPQEHAGQGMQRDIGQLDGKRVQATADNMVGGEAQHTERTAQRTRVRADGGGTPLLETTARNQDRRVLRQHGRGVVKKEIANIGAVDKHAGEYGQRKQADRAKKP